MQASETDESVEEPVEEEVSEVPEAIPNVEAETTTTTAPPTTTTESAPTETATTETTTVPGQDAPDVTVAVTNPGDVPGASAEVTQGLGVITEPGDPLNVRSGPGATFQILDELPHQTTGITSTHVVSPNSIEWRFIELNGEPLGWVAARFLQRDGSVSFCSAPAEMPSGLVSHSPVRVDIDGDNIRDTVAVFPEQLGDGLVKLWVRSDLSGGGVVAGAADPLRGAPESPELQVQFVTNTDALNFNSQFIVQISATSSGDEWTVLDLEGCDVEPTTIGDQPFIFSEGRFGNQVFSRGCRYSGENRFVILADSPSNRAIDQYVLNGTEWTLATQEIVGVGGAAGELPLPDGFTPCIQG